MKTSKKAYTYKMNLVPANILGIVIFIILILITYLFGTNLYIKGNFFLLLLIIIIYLVLHELIHGIGYILGGTKAKTIVFGISLEKGILYCQAFQEISKKNILISLLLPFLTIGVITYVVGTILNIELLVLLSIINLVGSSMDIMMFIYILKLPKNITYSESGEPDEFVLISNDNLTKYRSLYFKVENTKEYKASDYKLQNIKRINISRLSFIFISIIIILMLITII